MKSLITCSLLLASSMLYGENSDHYASIRQEVTQSIARGNAWLLKQQKPEGYWDDPELPAFTALALNAIVRDPNFKATDANASSYPPEVEKGFQWLLKQQKQDGGIYSRGLGVYNTATAITAMAASGRKDFESAIVKARAYLIKNQWDIGEPGKNDNPSDGGVGYGSKDDASNLSTTYLAMEALVVSNKVVADGKYGKQPDLNWESALQFLSRCQNLEKTNDQPKISEDQGNKGGFNYGPAESKAEDVKLEDGRTALRSQGSMSYAGLLSLIYAKLSPDDPRVIAVKEWLGRNYTLDENPGMGGQGLYYYFQAMSKALTAANMDTLPLADGKQVDWRKELATRMLTLQREDGSWVNNNGRFMESNALLVTSYSVLALEQILDSFPR